MSSASHIVCAKSPITILSINILVLVVNAATFLLFETAFAATHGEACRKEIVLRHSDIIELSIQ